MFERKLEIEIKKYLEQDVIKPILVMGARQVGKTTLAKKISNDYKSSFYINLEADPFAREIFETSALTFKDIFSSISLLKNSDITENTIIVIDEIQVCPRAITALKYFCEENKNYKIIATGSNLGTTVFNSKYSFPVGKVKQFVLYPMSFSEFLLAIDKKTLVDALKLVSYKKPLPEPIHKRVLQDFDIYLELGGMPEVIDSFVKGKTSETSDIKKNILSNYKSDCTKYANPNLTSRIINIYENVDVMLQKNNQKFLISEIDTPKYRDLANPLEWLIKSNLVIKVHQVKSVNIPLRGNIKESQFKLFMSDTGLLLSQANYSYFQLKQENDKIYYGLVIENYVATQLFSLKYDLFYYHKDKLEIDFLIQHGLDVIPIEVKSGSQRKSKSLNAYNTKYSPKFSLKFTRSNFSNIDTTYQIPLYAIEFLDIYLKDIVN